MLGSPDNSDVDLSEDEQPNLDQSSSSRSDTDLLDAKDNSVQSEDEYSSSAESEDNDSEIDQFKPTLEDDEAFALQLLQGSR